MPQVLFKDHIINVKKYIKIQMKTVEINKHGIAYGDTNELH